MTPATPTPNSIRDAWLKCDPCDGYGYFSDGHPNDPWAGSYACSACGGEGVRPGGADDWRDVMALWRATPGDQDTKAEALAERYDDELIEAIGEAMALEATASAEERRAA